MLKRVKKLIEDYKKTIFLNRIEKSKTVDLPINRLLS